MHQLLHKRSAVMTGRKGLRIRNGQWTGVRESSDREAEAAGHDMGRLVCARAGSAGVAMAKIGGRRIEEKEEGVPLPFGRMGIYLTRKRGRRVGKASKGMARK